MQRVKFPIQTDRLTLLGGILWIFSLEFFVGQVIAQLAWKGPPSYSLISNAISDLGVTACGNVSIAGVSSYYCSPLHNVMNVTFILTGAFMVAGVFLTRRAWPWNRPIASGFALVALAGLGKALAGLAPADVDFTLHFIGSLGIILGDVGMILIGRALRGKVDWVSKSSQILGYIGLIGFLSFLVAGHSGVGGLLERIGSYPIILWCTMVGLSLMLNRRSISEPKSPKSEPDST